MKLLLLILASLAAIGTLYEVPGDKLSEAMQPTITRHDEPTLIAQCGTMQYGYGAGDCAASSYGAYQAFGAECAASPSAYGYQPYGYSIPRYSYVPSYSYQPAYGGYSYAPPPTYYGYPAYRPTYGFGFRIGW